MHKIKITAIRKADYKDLQQKYENPIQHACDIQEGQVFIANGWQRPEGMCESAWESISPFVMTLAHGGEDIYDGWMKNPKSAMISCNDGFRPVSFLIEVMEEIHEHKNGHDFYKESEEEQIWRVETPGEEGPYLFSFDQKTVFNFWTDYPDKLTPDQIEIFKKENPTMASLK